MTYKFHVCASSEAFSPTKGRAAFVLFVDRWDDFGSKIQFKLAHVAKDGELTTIGDVKILQLAEERNTTEPTTKLPKSFAELPANSISIGQGDKYYKNLKELLGDEAHVVLEALNDIAWQPKLAEQFETLNAYRNALLRENSAQRARRFGLAWMLGLPAKDRADFIYECQIDGAEIPFETNFKFDHEDELPGRIVGVIGRNAVGKTRLLANLAEDLTQVSRTSVSAVDKKNERFKSDRPVFTRVIAISYSAFDRFRRPQEGATTSYIYCGVRNSRGALSRTSIIETYRENQRRILAHGRESQWARYVQTILGDMSQERLEDLTSEISAATEDGTSEPLASLSSGQAILCHLVTALLAWIEPKSIVLFDEPETHLHPNAVANLFQVLTRILQNFDSFAVLATHSPVVIQEIPSKRVIVLRRDENVTTSEELGIESFGESVTELTKHVFETVEVDNLYRKTLKQIAQHESLDDVLERFDGALSLHAKAFLIAQYAKSGGN